MELVTFQDLAARFPIGAGKDQVDTWGNILRRFMDEKKLLERKGPDCLKWHYRTLPSPKGYPSRFYKLDAVITCVCREAQSDKPRPMVSMLCDTYYNEFCLILQQAKKERELSESPDTSRDSRDLRENVL